VAITVEVLNNSKYIYIHKMITLITLNNNVFKNNFFFAEANLFNIRLLKLFILLKVRVLSYMAKALSLWLRLTASMTEYSIVLILIIFLLIIILDFQYYILSLRAFEEFPQILLTSTEPFEIMLLSILPVIVDPNVGLDNKDKTIINPYTITGYVEAEGNFSIAIYKYNTRVSRYLTFNIHIHSEDIIFLTLLKDYFNCGTISSINNKGHITYTVKRIDDIFNIIIPFFTKYPLRGTKHLDFILFVEAANIFKEGNHLTDKGTARLLELKNLINTNRDKSKFIQPSHTILGNKDYIPLDPNYISGFTIGDGYFSLRKNSSNHLKTVFGSLSYGITQHIDNTNLLNSILLTLALNSAKIHKKSLDSIQINISDRAILNNIIVPFFDLYPLYGMKLIDFLKVKDILKLLNDNSINGRVKWTSELKEEILRIWGNNTSILNENASLKSKGW